MLTQLVDEGVQAAGLLAQVVAMFADHLPLYRQEKIFGRAGLAIARLTWLSGSGKPACGSSR